MSQELQGLEEARRRRAEALLRACEGGLSAAVGRMGGDLLSFSAKVLEGDCLITLRADFPGGRMIAFVGSETLAGALLKAEREGRSDGLRWRADRFGAD